MLETMTVEHGFGCVKHGFDCMKHGFDCMKQSATNRMAAMNWLLFVMAYAQGTF